MPYLKLNKNGQLTLAIFIQPKAAKNRIIGLHDQELKIAITAPPVDGKANKATIAFLAKFFSLAKANITIWRGQLNRHKLIHLRNISLDEAQQKINASLN